MGAAFIRGRGPLVKFLASIVFVVATSFETRKLSKAIFTSPKVLVYEVYIVRVFCLSCYGCIFMGIYFRQEGRFKVTGVANPELMFVQGHLMFLGNDI